MHVTPSVKVFVVALISVIGVSALLYYAYHEQKKNVSASQALSVFVANTSKSIAELDSDHDGLKNWEETLWGTDPNNPDTDGDGTPDGEEAEHNRNPAKKGADTITDASSFDVPDYFKNSTSTTEAVGRELFAKYIALKRSGTFSAVTQASLVNDLNNTILASGNINVSYKKEDLLVVPNILENNRTYKKEMESVSTFIANAGLKGSELMTIALAVNNHPDDLNAGMHDLDPYITVNEQALRQFETVHVPENMVQLQIQFLDSYGSYVETLHMIREAANDPIRGMIASGTYLQREKLMQAAYAKIKTYLLTIPS